MALRYRYYEGKDGRHYCYAPHPTFACPLADPVVYQPSDDGEGEGTWTLRDETREAIYAAAQALGVEPVDLAKMLRTMHQRRGQARRRDAAGKLTDTCDTCGGKLKRLGFRAWIEREPREEELTSSDRIGQQFNGRPNWRTDETHYFGTKKEAIEWAREESKIERTTA